MGLDLVDGGTRSFAIHTRLDRYLERSIRHRIQRIQLYSMEEDRLIYTVCTESACCVEN